ncbi:TAXI family TRAP transporter solute-binding subunit [Jatrophihabitans telluris]|uniref:TAXI family TRAP transporter solute-binding subunit n=1 Tax=Jatrophihabitans telluris TaxID=2038343 RepID=A0ABY4QUJ0_9ACTN|nr:TAXI family TRAP transporter solute-binding subunit [Jatrophihabitans telluris]UQX86742.1 TAXI family TRAP transporter solute-binding subunit [Jatrophihabitans telluris]
MTDRRALRRMVTVSAAILVAAGVIIAWSYRASHRLPSPSGTLRISSGAPGGVYATFAEQFATQLHARDGRLRVTLTTSTGSLDNLQRIGAGSADCAVTAADAASLAVHGDGVFSHPVQIGAVSRLYDDYIQLVATDASGINRIDDLRGKRVSTGAANSGVQLIANRVLQLSHVPGSAMRPSSLGLADDVSAMRSGRLDAFFWSGGLPTPSVATLLQSGGVHLVPLTSVATAMSASYPGAYRAATIPTGAYNLKTTVATVAVANFLVCRADLPLATAEFLTATLFGRQSRIAAVVAPLNMLDPRTAIATDPVPLLAGAERWFRSRKN